MIKYDEQRAYDTPDPIMELQCVVKKSHINIKNNNSELKI